MNYETLVAVAEAQQAVILSKKDFETLMANGRVWVRTNDKKKLTNYRVYKDFGNVTGVQFIVTSVDDNGERQPVYVKVDGKVIFSVKCSNLIPFNGINLPAIHSNYQGESW